MAFRVAIATACRNPLLVEVYRKIMNRLFQSAELSGLLGDETHAGELRDLVGSAATQHAALARAVATGDVSAATVAGAAHLDDIERCLIDRLV